MKKLVLWALLIPVLAISCSKTASLNSEEAKIARTGLSTPSPDLKRTGLMGKVKSVTTTKYEARLMFGEITPVNELEYDSVSYDEYGFTIFELNKDYEHKHESSSTKEYNSDHYVTKSTYNRSESGYSESSVETIKYDDYNNVIERIYPNYEGGMDTVTSAYKYDEYGRILEAESRNKKVTYQYNRLGYILESREFEKDSLIEQITNTYFQDSLLKTSIRVYNGQTYTTEVEYDSLGHRLKETKTGGFLAGVRVYHPDGTQVWTTDDGDVYESGEHYMKSRRAKLTEHTPIEESHESDQWGNDLKTEYTWYYSGVYGPHYIYSTLSWEYQYDDHHNWIKKAQYTQTRGKEKNLRELSVRKIEYYE